MDRAQTEQKSTRNRWILGMILLVFFLFLLIAVYLRSPYAKIRSLHAVGAPDLAAGMLFKDVNLSIGENLFTVSGQAVSYRLLADFPILSSVQLQRNILQQSITLVLHEKKVAGILDNNGSLYRLLSDGTVLDQDPAAVGINLPIISSADRVAVTIGERLQNAAVLVLLQQMSQMSANSLDMFSEFHIEPWQGTTAILGYTKDGFEVRMSIDSVAASVRLFLGIHAKLLQMHAKPGLIDLFSSQTGVYTPYS